MIQFLFTQEFSFKLARMGNPSLRWATASPPAPGVATGTMGRTEILKAWARRPAIAYRFSGWAKRLVPTLIMPLSQALNDFWSSDRRRSLALFRGCMEERRRNQENLYMLPGTSFGQRCTLFSLDRTFAEQSFLSHRWGFRCAGQSAPSWRPGDWARYSVVGKPAIPAASGLV